jgi:hypothetical protein
VRLIDIADKVRGRIIVDKEGVQVNFAYTGDLLSDVMGHCCDESVLITIQNHLNTIAVCTLVGIEVVLICHDRPIPDDMLEAAKREGVAIISKSMSQFESSVALSELKPGVK